MSKNILHHNKTKQKLLVEKLEVFIRCAHESDRFRVEHNDDINIFHACSSSVRPKI